jgi:hypothetical protein
MRREILTWADVDHTINALIPQLRGTFDAMLIVTRGGVVPGGLISEALNIKYILTAAVSFPAVVGTGKLMAWPDFLQFPEAHLLGGRRTLVVDDVWGSGRTITAVKNRVEAAGGYPELCVLHFNPGRSLFGKTGPTYYAAITDAHIVYPWEVARPGGLDPILAVAPPPVN